MTWANEPSLVSPSRPSKYPSEPSLHYCVNKSRDVRLKVDPSRDIEINLGYWGKLAPATDVFPECHNLGRSGLVGPHSKSVSSHLTPATAWILVRHMIITSSWFAVDNANMITSVLLLSPLTPG